MGTALTMKAAVGVGAFDALNQSLSYTLDIKVGHVLAVVQLTMVIVQLLILGRKASWRILLQIPLSTLFGQFINLFYYEIYAFIDVENYVIRLMMLIIGTLWVSFFIGAIMVLDLVTMPVESFGMILAESINKDFGKVRQIMDIIFIIISLALTFIFSLPYTFREGTIISAFLFGPGLSVFMPRIKTVFEKWNLIDATLTSK